MLAEKVYGWLERAFPPACQLCDAPAAPGGICAACRGDLPWIGAACRLCGRPLPAAGRCGRCLVRPPPWGAVVAPLAWAFPVDALVTRFKYGGALHHGRLLGLLLAASVADRPVHAVLPVPLHPSRQAERGFNQACELARPAAAAVGAPLWAHDCRRIRDTAAQAGLSGASRRRNPSGAFLASGRVEGLDVAVVDDVLTTGATAAAVTAALRAAGAARVEVWAVARGGVARHRAQAWTKV